jgi:CubicO group peptidase (beta-lactamase class C family)
MLLCGCSGPPLSLLDEASHATSEEVCNGALVTGLAGDEAFRLQLRPEPGMWAVAWAVHYDVDRARGEVRSDILGRYPSRAVWREGRGCTLVASDGQAPAALHIAPSAPPALPGIAGPDIVVARDPALRAAIDAAFAERGDETPVATKAVVVVHDGQVIGERYAPGIGIDTPLSGHSLAKSVVNALLGVLVRDRKLDVNARADAPEWQTPGDPRGRITIADLMRMDTGFDFDEGAGAGTATHMWYLEPDIAHFAASRPLVTLPRLQWHYSSGSYAILSRILKETVGPPQALNDFAHREIFGPLGMRDATIEFDSAGNMMGAHAVFASARDWARFGQFYLNDGIAGNVRILPEGWVRFSTTPTLGTGYGAGFWLNTTHAPVPIWGFPWGLPGVPADAFMGRGYMGQWIVIVPSERLVVTRFGYSHGDAGAMTSVAELVHGVIAALHDGGW